MSDAERLLAELWAADEPAERDPRFALAVMQTIERRRFWIDIAGFVPAIVAVCAMLAALGPALAQAIAAAMPPLDNGLIAPLAAGVVMAGVLWSWVTGRLGALSGVN